MIHAVLTEHGPPQYTRCLRVQTPNTQGFPDKAMVKTQNPLAPRLTDPHLTLHTKCSHFCARSPQMLTKPSSCPHAQVPTDTLNHTHTPCVQIQNKAKPLPSDTQPHRSHVLRFAQRRQTYRCTLFLADPPAQIKPTSLPSRTHSNRPHIAISPTITLENKKLLPQMDTNHLQHTSLLYSHCHIAERYSHPTICACDRGTDRETHTLFLLWKTHNHLCSY